MTAETPKPEKNLPAEKHDPDMIRKVLTEKPSQIERRHRNSRLNKGLPPDYSGKMILS